MKIGTFVIYAILSLQLYPTFKMNALYHNIDNTARNFNSATVLLRAKKVGHQRHCLDF
jgi:hypothetical protein